MQLLFPVSKFVSNLEYNNIKVGRVQFYFTSFQETEAGTEICGVVFNGLLRIQMISVRISERNVAIMKAQMIFLSTFRETRAVIVQSVWRWATGWMIGVLGFDSRRGLGIFLFTTASRPALGSTQPPIQWVRGAFSLGVKRPGREADHSPPSSAEVKECVELHLHSPNTRSWRGAPLKHRDNFIFTFYLQENCR
jgi:hypothetical protein